MARRIATGRSTTTRSRAPDRSDASRPARRAFGPAPREAASDTQSQARGLRGLWQLVQCSIRNWSSDQAATLGAALAFYSAFSIAPLLVILVTIAGWLAGEQSAYGHLESQLRALFGAGTADILIHAMSTSQHRSGILATVVSAVSLLVGASSVFSALENALELIWGTRKLVPGGVRGFVRTRLLSFGLILALGFLLVVSLTLSTAMTALRDAVAARYTSLVVLTGVLDSLLSAGLVATLIALMYRFLPVRHLPWRSVIVGALVTALLFELGRWAIGLYLGRATQPSAFGAAASFVALLLWLYYTAQIFLFGAEFTACLGGLRTMETGEQHKPIPREGEAR